MMVYKQALYCSYKNPPISSLFARRAKKASAEGRSPPRSGLYLLVMSIREIKEGFSDFVNRKTCTICGKESKSTQSLFMHIAVKHEKVGVPLATVCQPSCPPGGCLAPEGRPPPAQEGPAWQTF